MLSLPERIYCLLNSIESKQRCKFCNGEVKFINMSHGYYDSCADCQEEKRRLTMGRPTYASVISSIDRDQYEVIDAPDGKISGKKTHLVVKCRRCGTTTKISLSCGAMFTRVMGKSLCKHCDKYASGDERAVRAAVKKIIGCKEEILLNDHTTITPYELDIAVPSLRVAVEFNGIYWHNDAAVKKSYH